MDDKVYLVYRIRDCDDPYYPSYEDVMRIYKSKENAINSCISLYKRISLCDIPNIIYYVKECKYDDNNDFHKHNLTLEQLNEIKIKNEEEMKDSMDEHNKYGIIFIIGLNNQKLYKTNIFI